MVTGRKIRPVTWWALAGMVSVTIFGYTWTRWIVSGNAKRTPHGPTPLPTYMRVAINVEEAVALVLLVICLYFFLVRPWRRERRLTLDGMLCIGLMTCYWQDLAANFIRPSYVLYNSYFIQFGSWTNYIPGFVEPNAHLFAEPVLWEWPLYIAFSMPPILLTNYLMRKAKNRWPQLGTFGLFMVAFSALAIADVCLEIPFLLQGLYTFPGAISWLTLFHGHYYQFPIYEPVLIGLYIGAFACVRYFTDDKGRTVAERGIDQVRASPRQKTWFRLFAIAGILNVIFLLSNISVGLIDGLYGSAWPKDIVSRSYLTNGLCGPGTDYACPSPSIPIPLRGSSHIGPDGKLVPEK
jgi:hypothetical protein